MHLDKAKKKEPAMSSSSASSFWTLMVSVLITLTSLGCGPADNPTTSDSAEDEAVDDDQTIEKVVTFQYDAAHTGFVGIIDGDVSEWGGGSGDRRLVAEIIVYLCMPPGTWADIWVGDETIPPPACSQTPCFGVKVQTPIDDTGTCLEVLPLPEE